MNAREFNEKYPIGTKVIYWPISNENEYELTVTRSEASTLGSGDVVVKIVGHTGGVSVDHIIVQEDLYQVEN